MLYTVVFTPEAEAGLLELYRYIATEASLEVASPWSGSDRVLPFYGRVDQCILSDKPTCLHR